jgi:cell division transport system ATP-binding protein
MLEMFHVYKSYEPAHTALYDINIKIDKGDFLFITGPSGAGKTTLLKLIFLEERVTKGQIFVDDTDISTIRSSKIPYLRRKMGIVFQDFRLLPSRTVFENVALVLEVIGSDRSYIQKRVMNTLTEVNLSDKSKCLCRSLSGSEQQKVAIARSIVNDPFILLADEPTGNLDPDSAQEIMAIFRHISSRGTTTVFATHHQGLANTIGGRFVMLENGMIIN